MLESALQSAAAHSVVSKELRQGHKRSKLSSFAARAVAHSVVPESTIAVKKVEVVVAGQMPPAFTG